MTFLRQRKNVKDHRYLNNNWCQFHDSLHVPPWIKQWARCCEERWTLITADQSTGHDTAIAARWRSSRKGGGAPWYCGCALTNRSTLLWARAMPRCRLHQWDARQSCDEIKKWSANGCDLYVIWGWEGKPRKTFNYLGRLKKKPSCCDIHWECSLQVALWSSRALNGALNWYNSCTKGRVFRATHCYPLQYILRQQMSTHDTKNVLRWLVLTAYV